MSTLPTADLEASTAPPANSGVKPLLVCLPSMSSEASATVISELSSNFPSERLIIATPDQPVEQPAADGLPHLIPYTAPRDNGEWVLSVGDYLAAAQLAGERDASAVLLLGTDAGSLHPDALRAMQAGLAAGADLALPRYVTAPDDALVNSALLYPLTRALFAADVRFPLPLDAGLSPRMLARLAEAANRPGVRAENGLLWPVAEASIAGFTVRQVEGGARVLPQPQEADLNALFPAVTGSLFSDVEAKATYWQRARVLPAVRPSPRTATGDANPDHAGEIRSLVEGFRIAFNNLREIWSLVLPPQSLLALKKLSLTSPESFHYPPGLWARTVYDFALAFHMRTLNRGHLLGSFTPLYLAWVASFLRNSDGDPNGAVELLSATAISFEQEKPYLVSRWRWPDRFNP